MYKLAHTYKKVKLICASTQSGQSLSVTREETLDPCQPKECLFNTLVRLRVLI